MQLNNDLSRCVDVLRKGGLLVAPSDTVYGLVCDATNEMAVKKLIAVKNRPFGKPISVFTAELRMIDMLVHVGEHRDIINTLLPGPFTVVLPSKHKVSPLLESERGTLGVRLPRYSAITQLVQAFGGPLTATSANLSGRPPHYEASGFMHELPQEKRALIDYVVDAGKLPHNKPSSIIDLSGPQYALLRKGDVMPLSATNYRSESPDKTRKTARFITESFLKKNIKKPLVIVLMGEMGVGKTVFAKGVGDALGVENVVSPTYVIYYEYPVHHDSIQKFVHADLFTIEEPEEFAHLGLETSFAPGVVTCIEWGEKGRPLFESMKMNAQVVIISISYENATDRAISVHAL